MDHTTPDSYKLLQSQHKDFLRGTHITDIYPRVKVLSHHVYLLSVRYIKLRYSLPNDEWLFSQIPLKMLNFQLSL